MNKSSYTNGMVLFLLGIILAFGWLFYDAQDMDVELLPVLLGVFIAFLGSMIMSEAKK